MLQAQVGAISGLNEGCLDIVQRPETNWYGEPVQLIFRKQNILSLFTGGRPTLSQKPFSASVGRCAGGEACNEFLHPAASPATVAAESIPNRLPAASPLQTRLMARRSLSRSPFIAIRIGAIELRLWEEP